MFFFFFSSRRRHTRLVSDWSSDVCSSDLDVRMIPLVIPPTATNRVPNQVTSLSVRLVPDVAADHVVPLGEVTTAPPSPRSEERRVGKECRSRWWPYADKKRKKGCECTDRV